MRGAAASNENPASSPPARRGRVELLENHDGEWINVLYSHGSLRWYDRPDFEVVHLNLSFRRVNA